MGASRGMIMVPLDFRWLRWGRASLLGVLSSSVSVEVFEFDCEAGGVEQVVAIGKGFDSVIDGTGVG